MGRHPLEADGSYHSLFEKWRYDAKEAEKRWGMTRFVNCSYCDQDSAGIHDANCPLFPDNKTMRYKQEYKQIPYNPVNFVTCKTPGEYGWICPVCGGGNAPTTQRCPCRGMESSSYTTTTVEDYQWLCKCGVKNHKDMTVCYFCKEDREKGTSDATRKDTEKGASDD